MERFANASSKDGRMVLSTCSKKDLGVVIPLVTAEREGFISFAERVPFFCACAASFPVRGLFLN